MFHMLYNQSNKFKKSTIPYKIDCKLVKSTIVPISNELSAIPINLGIIFDNKLSMFYY